ncbi:MAG: SO_0444 family Cu/Zn efflux transporter [Phycisphaeraceae bacterium]|nr:SO_0444 family Cu/Zn efflux transporter [Phycisphaerales bacterium]MCB9860268.1 SO_0444 family Cu/Zn efflux transporter [Phycisphaeraceae bacterium]
MDRFWEFVDNFWQVLAESGLWLGIGFLVAGLLHVYVPTKWVEKHLKGRTIGSVIKAAVFGVPIPLCSCSVIPTVAALRRKGASRGSSAAFAISSPEIDGPSIALTWGLLGPVMAIARPIGALVSAITAGVLINRFCEEDETASVSEKKHTSSHSCGCASRKSTSCCSSGMDDDITLERPLMVSGGAPSASSCCSSQKQSAIATETSCCGSKIEESSCCSGDSHDHDHAGGLLGALKYGFVTLPAMLAVWLFIGLALSAAASTWIPTDTMTRFGSGPLALVVALVIGLPLYVCATSSTPFAKALVVAGLSPGAALVFLLAGPATNMTTMMWVLQDLGRRALLIYIAVISVVAVGFGFLFQIVSPSIAGAMGLESAGHTTHTVTNWHAAIGAALLAVGLFVVLRRELQKVSASRKSATQCKHHNDAATCPHCAQPA